MSFAASILGKFVAEQRIGTLSPLAVEHAKRHLIDAVGVGVLGSAQPMPRRALDGIVAIPGTPGNIPVWGSELTLTAPYAAMANGIACHALDFDDTHTEGIVHGSAILAPTVLALGTELQATGEQLITAFVVGWEVAARIGLAAQGSIHDRGYHTTSVAGVFGAAAAAGKLLGLPADRVVHALALAGSQACGINEYQSNGSSSKILHTGWAAHAGIVAAYLARAGMTGPLSIFEGSMGLLSVYGDAAKVVPAALTGGLGQRWEMTRVGIKPYPCCHFLHAFIDCAKALRTAGVKPDDITAIECIVPEIEVALVCEPLEFKRIPISPYAAKFSLPYAVAAALIDGEVSHRTFTAEGVTRPEALELAARVSYRIAAPEETTFPRYFPGWLKASLRDGSSLEERIDVNLGTPENPLSRLALDAKFRDNAAAVLPATQVEELLASLWSLERCSAADIGELTRQKTRSVRRAAANEINLAGG
jgi:2-methylcitrate dehydratase PrpD